MLNAIPFIIEFVDTVDLLSITSLSHETRTQCEQEWRMRVLKRYYCAKNGAFRDNSIPPVYNKKRYMLRRFLEKSVVDRVSARVYLMNAEGETVFFHIAKGQKLLCSKERAVLFARCERMFDLSLRINHSIQEISNLIGMVSLEEARGILDEHIQLMTSVTKLRSALSFESELYQVFPSPILLDANCLLRHTYHFNAINGGLEFLSSPLVMMQIWVSIDGLVYRPLAPPSTILHPNPMPMRSCGGSMNDSSINIEGCDRFESLSDIASTTETFYTMNLHELSGMTVNTDDNTLRYRFEKQTAESDTIQGSTFDSLPLDSTRYEFCLNTLISNTYLLYLFNPINFCPSDWTYQASLEIGRNDRRKRYLLPVQREGVFLNTKTYILRIFLSYGRIEEHIVEDGMKGRSKIRGSKHSKPLDIELDVAEEHFSFEVTALNRSTKEQRSIVSVESSFRFLEKGFLEQQNAERILELNVAIALEGKVSYFIMEPLHKLQYVEFAVNLESLVDLLGISPFASPSITS